MSSSPNENDLPFSNVDVHVEEFDFLDDLSQVADDPLTASESWQVNWWNNSHQYQDQSGNPGNVENCNSVIIPTCEGVPTTGHNQVAVTLPDTAPISVATNSTADTGPAIVFKSGVISHQNVSTEVSPAEEGPSKAIKTLKICNVCGDVAKSLHFGGLSCDSCKAFFRRAVQQNNDFRCSYNNTCVINISTRKSCQHCRFNKCLAIGMEKKWVMSDEDRVNFQKQRLEKKQKPETRTSDETSNLTQSTCGNVNVPEINVQEYEPQVSEMLNYMSAQDQTEIEQLIHKFHQSYTDIPYRVSQCPNNRNSMEVIEMFTTILRRMVYFHKHTSDFNSLSVLDQSTLMRQGVLEMCMLRSALTYDFTNSCWPKKTENMEFLKQCPTLHIDDMKKLVTPELYTLQMNFISSMQELSADEPIVILLSLIVLFYPDRTGLQDLEKVSQIQDKYLKHLRNYTQWRFGSVSGSKVYPKLLTKLSDLRQLNDSHNQYNIRLEKSQIHQIQQQMSAINLNPYTQWEELVKCDLQQEIEVGRVNPLSLPEASNIHENVPFKSLLETTRKKAIPFKSSTAKISTPLSDQSSLSASSRVRNFFNHMVNRQIPIFLENPMATLSTESEMANASKYFASMEHGRLPKFSRVELHDQAQASGGYKDKAQSPYSSVLTSPSSQSSTIYNPQSDFSEQLNLEEASRAALTNISQPIYSAGSNTVTNAPSLPLNLLSVHSPSHGPISDNLLHKEHSQSHVNYQTMPNLTNYSEVDTIHFNYNNDMAEKEQANLLEGYYYDNSSLSRANQQMHPKNDSTPYTHFNQNFHFNGNDNPLYESSSTQTGPMIGQELQHFFEPQSTQNYFGSEQPCTSTSTSSNSNRQVYDDTRKYYVDPRIDKLVNKWST